MMLIDVTVTLLLETYQGDHRSYAPNLVQSIDW